MLGEDDLPLGLDSGNKWKISGRDAEILSDLKLILRWWLPIFSEVDDLRQAVDVLEVIENIIHSGAKPTNIYHVTASRVDVMHGGYSVTIIVSPDGIDLNCDEWVSTAHGRPECGSMIARDGRPLSVHLDRMGSYDRIHFDLCWHQAMEVGPEGPDDSFVTGHIRVEN